MTNDAEQRLAEIHTACWDNLIRAQNDRRSEFRWMNLATIDTNANPQIRTVVLRGVSRKDRTIVFHTDNRSAKWSELNANKAVSLHFHARRVSVQMRLSGQVLIPGDSKRQDAWQNSHEGTRKTYAQAVAPGTPLPLSEKNNADGLAHDDTAPYANFAVVHVIIGKIDWLELAQDQHRRAVFTYGERGELSATWVAP